MIFPSLIDRRVGDSHWEPYPRGDDGKEHTVVGTLKILREVESPQLGNRRDLLIYLPPSYGWIAQRRYPVIYMHDGQNLFDAATSFSGEWRVDETLEEVGQAGLEAIVVGIPNMGRERCDEYSPWNDAKYGGGRGDAYLDWIVDGVKPMIDRDFRTLPDREHTGIAGSSMGGLISLYGFFRRPDAFGFAAALSPALWFAGRSIFAYVESAAHAPGRVYLDVGTAEGQNTVRDARRMRDLLHAKRYDAEHELMYVEEQGAGHSEAAWAARLHRVLTFILPPLSEPAHGG